MQHSRRPVSHLVPALTLAGKDKLEPTSEKGSEWGLRAEGPSAQATLADTGQPRLLTTPRVSDFMLHTHSAFHSALAQQLYRTEKPIQLS